ncbi:hypothetical protein [Trinickia acidisoli]|uniref:hypothetical protein n=1 Tax=Trinickia acidisoli TaxID=2767482 RepID=UPI001A8D3911|nr:hypothetical protein [Trinickia acidisoli]
MEANRAEQAEPVSKLTLTVGVLTTPAAWLLQTCAGEALIAHTCFPHDIPLSTPLAPGVGWGVIGLSGMTLVVGVFGTWLAWRNWQRLKRARHGRTLESNDTKVEGEAFVARVGFMASGLFLFALVATDVAIRLVSACS